MAKQNLEDYIYRVILDYPELMQENDNLLCWHVWKRELKGEEITKDNIQSLSSCESILRERRFLKQNSRKWTNVELKLAKLNNNLFIK